MSAESALHLNTNTLVGMTETRGNAWHYRADLQGDESNHYPRAIPLDDVNRRLFHWTAIPTPVAALVPCEIEDDRMSGIGADGRPFRMITDDTRQAIVRSDTGLVMGVFKSGYRVHAYSEWLIDTVGTILDDDLSIGSAGLLRGGAQAWVQVEMPESIVTPSGVEFRPHLLAATSCDGSLATTFKRTMTNVVCDNTMGAGLAEAGQEFKARHSKFSGLRIGDARKALEIVHTMSDEFAAGIERLTNTTVTDDQFAEIIATQFGDADAETERAKTIAQNRAVGILNLWNNDLRVQPWKGTAWGALQAMNTWAHHVQGVRGDTPRFDRNMSNSLTGKTDEFDLSVLTTITRVLAPV